MTDSISTEPPVKPKPVRLVWLDLETTGLDPETGEILELAAIVTDLYGHEVKNAAGQSRFSRVFRHRREDILTLMDDYVLAMHLRSGLLPEVANGQPIADVWWDFYSFLLAAGKPVFHLAGNSIHFDRSWLDAESRRYRDLTKAMKLIHYRMLDVSSFLLVRPDWRADSEPVHRAMADVEHSLQTYREKILPAISTSVRTL